MAKFYKFHIEPKIEEVKKKQEEHDLRFKEILGHFDSIYHRFERLQTEYYSITEALRRIEEKLDKEVGKEKELEKDLKGLKRQVINLSGAFQFCPRESILSSDKRYNFSHKETVRQLSQARIVDCRLELKMFGDDGGW